ncbi:MAG: translocation/assembly module TamB domain-containing protein, partial [Longimicrobiales bacterium]
LTGTIEEPTVDGNLVLTGGSVRVPVLRQTYTNMTARLVLDGRTITVTPFQLHSDGPMTVTGHITLENLTSPVTDLDVHFDRFRAVGVPGTTDAALTGDLTLNGPREALEMSGSVRIADGYVPIPQFGAGSADFLSELPAGEVLGLPEGPAASSSLYDGLKITDLRVQVATDVWFTAEAARAQLSGDLTINKKVEDDFTVLGTLEGERGSYTLQAGPIVRNFEVTHTEVRFLGGPEINPAIDITARRIVFDAQGGEIDMDVRVTGTVRSPRLDLASPDAPDFPPEELLSMLFFGRSSLELGGGGLSGAEVLETTFLGSWAELATLELEETLVRNLGLSFDIFQVRFGPGGLGGFGAPAFVFGWEVGRDVFLTAETALAGLFESTGTAANPWALRLEWAFAPDARLRASFETVEPTRYVQGVGLRLPITRKQQFSLEVRRRWTY